MKKSVEILYFNLCSTLKISSITKSKKNFKLEFANKDPIPWEGFNEAGI